MRKIIAALACAAFLLGGGDNPVQANHAGRCEAAPRHMLVPHWIQTELCDYKDTHNIPNFTATSVTLRTGDGMVTYDALYFGDEFVAMLMFEIDENGMRGQLLFYGSEISGKRYYAPEKGVGRIEL